HGRGIQLASGPAGPSIEELRARGADEQDARLARPVRNVLHEVEEGWLGPVDVVQDHDEGALGGKRLEELAHSPRDLLPAPERLVAAAAPPPSPTDHPP